MEHKKPAGISAKLPFLGPHQVRTEARFVLEQVIQIHPLHKQQSPTRQVAQASWVRAPGDLKVDQIRPTVFAHNHIVPFIGINIGHAPLVQRTHQLYQLIKKVVGYTVLGVFEQVLASYIGMEETIAAVTTQKTSNARQVLQLTVEVYLTLG